jgi:hypothetical protein
MVSEPNKTLKYKFEWHSGHQTLSILPQLMERTYRSGALLLGNTLISTVRLGRYLTWRGHQIARALLQSVWVRGLGQEKQWRSRQFERSIHGFMAISGVG